MAPHASDDEEIIEAVLRGQPDRYAELVVKYQRAAWKIAYGFVGNMDDARELSQNGFVKAYWNLRRFQRRAKFSTWLYRIVVNECKDFFKRARRRPATVSLSGQTSEGEEIVFDVEDPSGTPSDRLANRELAAQIGAAIAALPAQQREAFLLHHVNGLSLDDAAEVMGCRVGTVKAHVFRACERLRERLAAARHAEAV